jgi:hypothetical protein
LLIDDVSVAQESQAEYEHAHNFKEFLSGFRDFSFNSQVVYVEGSFYHAA